MIEWLSPQPSICPMLLVAKKNFCWLSSHTTITAHLTHRSQSASTIGIIRRQYSQHSQHELTLTRPCHGCLRWLTTSGDSPWQLGWLTIVDVELLLIIQPDHDWVVGEDRIFQFRNTSWGPIIRVTMGLIHRPARREFPMLAFPDDGCSQGAVNSGSEASV